MYEYRYADFARKYLVGNMHQPGPRIKVRCLFHVDTDPSMSFHLDQGWFRCFSCDEKGGILKLSRRIGLTIIGDDYIEELDDPSAEWAAFVRSLDEVDPDDGSPQPWQENRLRPFLGASTPYWSSRGFNDRTIKAWQLGYDRIRNHAIIPVRAPFTDRLVGITRRQLDPGAKPKYIDAKNFKKNRTLFGTWVETQGDNSRWVLTEGPLDAIKVWQAGYNGRATMGGILSREQIDIMLKYGVTDVVLFFDDDKPGFRKAMSAYGKLKNKFEVFAATYGYNTPTDPGDMTAAQIKIAIKKAVPLNDYLPV